MPGAKQYSDTLFFLEVSSNALFQIDPISLLIYIQNAVGCGHTHPEIPSSWGGGGEIQTFFSIAMHYWISDTNVPVSNPKVNEIYLCEPIHSTEKKSLYQHISPPPPSKDSSHPLPKKKRKEKKLITLHYATDGVLNTVFQAVGVKKKSPSCHTSLVLQRT